MRAQRALVIHDVAAQFRVLRKYFAQRLRHRRARHVTRRRRGLAGEIAGEVHLWHRVKLANALAKTIPLSCKRDVRCFSCNAMPRLAFTRQLLTTMKLHPSIVILTLVLAFSTGFA